MHMPEQTTVPWRLAIIGGGQAAMAMLMATLERVSARRAPPWRGIELFVFERADEFGTGPAWSPSQLLPVHLSSLASEHSRAAFGAHQCLQFSRCVGMHVELGSEVRLMPRTQVTRIKTEGTLWRLTTAGGHGCLVEVVVPAMGRLPGLQNRPPGALRPWPASVLQDALNEGGAKVLVMGTSLTGVDAALTAGLAAGSFETDVQGVLRYVPRRRLRVIMASRSAEMPAVWGPGPRPWPEFEREFAAALDALIRHHGRLPLRHALEALCGISYRLHGGLGGFDEPGLTFEQRLLRLRALKRLRVRDPMLTLRRDLAQATGLHADCELPRQRTLLAALPLLSEAFPALGAEDHALFEAHLRTPLYRHGMPMGSPTARCLLAMMEAGVLQVQRLTADQVRRVGAGWAAIDTAGRVLEVDHVIDALGPVADPSQLDDELLRDALRQGHARPARRACASGSAAPGIAAGIDVHPGSRRVRGRAGQPPLYAMGTLTFGLFLDAQAIGHLVRDAEAIAGDLDRLLESNDLGCRRRSPHGALHG
jgi:uncharacterized NAD(P)/FAD-binding protein YdhS